MCNDPLMDVLWLALSAGMLASVGTFCYYMINRRIKKEKMEEKFA